MIGRIATGEIEDEREALSSAAAELGRKGGKKRAENMTPERRAEIARKAAATRWQKTT
jgi:general stress protein YciG